MDSREFYRNGGRSARTRALTVRQQQTADMLGVRFLPPGRLTKAWGAHEARTSVTERGHLMDGVAGTGAAMAWDRSC